MKPNCIIQIHEIVKILESKPVKFISIIPSFFSSIDLRTVQLIQRKDLSDYEERKEWHD
jgi:hypothetical protein